MLKRLLLYAVGGLLMGAAAMLFESGKDYSAIPPQAREVETTLRGQPVDLAQAILAAQELTGGVVASARFDLNNAAKTIEIIVFADGAKRRLTFETTGCSVESDVMVPRFPGDAVQGDWIETDSGLKYFDLVEGDGPQPAGPSSKVTVHYTGWLVDGTKFDSSVDRGQPTTFTLGRVIGGWTEGVGSMRVGGKRKLIIPYDLAYGERGSRSIPPKATLIFDVELLEIIEE
ncbi:MAG: FKBP-type peptidyl-prolyl cis-trans isomerase [Planctomycetota bacterium]|nr:FKBP-type peptidyl-prolyl cis-trans isomerase [Planctomycetota bacterium]